MTLVPTLFRDTVLVKLLKIRQVYIGLNKQPGCESIRIPTQAFLCPTSAQMYSRGGARPVQWVVDKRSVIAYTASLQETSTVL